MTNTREEVAVAEAVEAEFIKPYIDMVTYGTSTYDASKLSENIAKAAIAASNSKYLAGLVEALNRAKAYAAGTNNIIERQCKVYEICQKALNNLPPELRQ